MESNLNGMNLMGWNVSTIDFLEINVQDAASHSHVTYLDCFLSNIWDV